MLKKLLVRRRLVLLFTLQTLISLGSLFYGNRIGESQIDVLGKLTRNMMEHSVNVEGALFRIQALPAEQTLDLSQAASVMYSDPSVLEESVRKVQESRADLNEMLDSLETALHDRSVSESTSEVRESVQRFNESIDKSTALLLKGQRPEGTEVLMNRCAQLGRALMEAVSKLESACTGAQSRKMDETRMLDDQRIASQRRMLLWLAASCFAAGAGFILAIERSVK